ncbi:MAG TPA: DUF58 domain-containing protein [Elusimicrobiota bacterium]|nr:DUF58 domain-containing protein [Elusimicrobiota bacterium]
MRNLRLALARRRSPGHADGRRRAAARGFSQEFAQHRAYAPGDDLKRLDWKVYARTDRLFLREHEDERSLPTWVLADVSGSMALGGKRELAGRLAMAAAFLSLARGDAAGLVCFDSTLRVCLPAEPGLGRLELLDRALEDSSPRGPTGLAAAMRGALDKIARRSRVVLVSDLLGSADDVLASLRALRARRHRLAVLQVLDPSERDLDWEGPVRFESLEDASSERVEPELLRQEYRRLFAERQRLYAASFSGSGAAFGEFYAGDDWLPLLGRLLGAP